MTKAILASAGYSVETGRRGGLRPPAAGAGAAAKIRLLLERAPSTHEEIAVLLGLRKSHASACLCNLKKAGMVWIVGEVTGQSMYGLTNMGRAVLKKQKRNEQ